MKKETVENVAGKGEAGKGQRVRELGHVGRRVAIFFPPLGPAERSSNRVHVAHVRRETTPAFTRRAYCASIALTFITAARFFIFPPVYISHV